MALPLLRDERPEWAVRELSRIVAERAGLACDSTAEDGSEPGLDVAPGDPVARPIGFRAGDRSRSEDDAEDAGRADVAGGGPGR